MQPQASKKYTKAQDDAADKKGGIKDGSPKDIALDLKRGVPVVPKQKKGITAQQAKRAASFLMARKGAK